MSNFIPNKFIKIDPKDLPWITYNIKNMIKIQNRMFKIYRRHGYLNEDKIRADKFTEDWSLAVHAAKDKYLRDLGDKLSDTPSQRSYWKIINK